MASKIRTITILNISGEEYHISDGENGIVIFHDENNDVDLEFTFTEAFEFSAALNDAANRSQQMSLQKKETNV